MNKRDFEIFKETLKEEFKNSDYVTSLELLVCLQQQSICKLEDEYVTEKECGWWVKGFENLIQPV